MDLKQLYTDIVSNGDPLYGYQLIDRNHINDLKIGMHIKYVKRILNPITQQEEDKLCDAGSLLKIINAKRIFELILQTSNKRIRFLKYKIYAKTDSIQQFYNLFKHDIEKRTLEMTKEQMKKIHLIEQNKHNYKIEFEEKNKNH